MSSLDFGKSHKGFLRYLRRTAAVVWFLLGLTSLVLGATGWLSSAQTWLVWFRGVEPEMWRILLTAVGAGMVAVFVVFFATLLLVRRNQLQRRKVAAEQAERERYVDYMTATHFIGRLVESIIGDRAGPLISQTQGLLDQFEEMCPEGKKGDLYDGGLLRTWLVYNMGYRLMHRNAELQWPPKYELKPPWFRYSGPSSLTETLGQPRTP